MWREIICNYFCPPERRRSDSKLDETPQTSFLLFYHHFFIQPVWKARNSGFSLITSSPGVVIGSSRKREEHEASTREGEQANSFLVSLRDVVSARGKQTTLFSLFLLLNVYHNRVRWSLPLVRDRWLQGRSCALSLWGLWPTRGHNNIRKRSSSFYIVWDVPFTLTANPIATLILHIYSYMTFLTHFLYIIKM